MYKRLIRKLKKDDLLYVKSIYRLGRVKKRTTQTMFELFLFYRITENQGNPSFSDDSPDSLLRITDRFPHPHFYFYASFYFILVFILY